VKHAKLKSVLIASAAVTFGLALVGCGVGNPSYDYKVTFDYNVGTLSDHEITSQYLAVQENSLIVKYPKEDDSDFRLKTIEGYDFDGWYFPVLDGEGKPVIGEDGRVQLKERIDFATYRVTSDVTLYANFAVKYKLTVLGKTEDGEDLTLKNETVYRGATGTQQSEPFGTEAARADGYTLVEYYEDEALTQKFSFPYTYGEEDKTIYAKFLQGDWNLVETPDQFNSALRDEKNIYLRSDLDYTDVKWTARAYSGKIRGNGHTVSNIACEWTGRRGDYDFYLFRFLGAGFEVHDLTFENVMLRFTASVNPMNETGYQVSAFAGIIQNGAVFDGFAYSCVLEIERLAGAANADVYAYEICKDPPEDLNRQFFDVTINGDYKQ